MKAETQDFETLIQELEDALGERDRRIVDLENALKREISRQKKKGGGTPDTSHVDRGEPRDIERQLRLLQEKLILRIDERVDALSGELDDLRQQVRAQAEHSTEALTSFASLRKSQRERLESLGAAVRETRAELESCIRGVVSDEAARNSESVDRQFATLSGEVGAALDSMRADLQGTARQLESQLEALKAAMALQGLPLHRRLSAKRKSHFDALLSGSAEAPAHSPVEPPVEDAVSVPMPKTTGAAWEALVESEAAAGRSPDRVRTAFLKAGVALRTPPKRKKGQVFEGPDHPFEKLTAKRWASLQDELARLPEAEA